MALTLSANPVNILEMTVSANETSFITWFPVVASETSSGVLTYEVDNTAAAATYTYTGVPVDWGIFSDEINTDVISVTALNDSAIIFISATNVAGEVDSEILLPCYIDTITISSTQLSAAVSAFYRQVSTDNILSFPINTEILWNIVPNYTDTYAGFSGVDNFYDLSLYSSISGFSPSASKLTFSYSGTSSDLEFYTIPQIVNDKYGISSLSSQLLLRESQIQVYLNPKIIIHSDIEQSTYVILSAIQREALVPNNTILSWNINDDVSVIGLTGTSLDMPYIFGNTGTSLTQIKLSALDLTNSYNYSLSAYTGIDTGVFRPYNTITDTSSLTARINRLPDESSTYKYTLQALGITEGISHIIAPLQYIRWETNDSNIATAKYSDNTTPYIFGTTSIATNIDNLYLQINPIKVTTTPKVCTVSFQICALSGSRIEDGIFNTYDFTIEYDEWLSEDNFDPRFRFQYEQDTETIIYRPSAVGSTFYNISNTSVLPDDSFGFIEFTFNTGVCSLSYDIRNNNPAPSGVTYEFSSLNEPICTISMTVSAIAAGYADYIIRSSTPKQIVFAEIPDASNFIAYPEFQWNGSSWEQAVFSFETNEGIIQYPNTPLSAYGMCHTENFFLSTATSSMDRYLWSVQDINNPSNQIQSISVSPTAWISFKTGVNSSFLSICAAVFTDKLSANMPSKYYDTISGIQFDNFSTTFDPTTSTNKQHIKIVGADEVEVIADMVSVSNIQLPTPNALNISGSYTDLDIQSAFTTYVNTFYFNISSEFWYQVNERADTIQNYIATKEVFINVDDIANSYLGTPLNETTQIEIIPGVEYTLQLKASHPSASDWCLENTINYNTSSSMIVTAYPMVPVIYNPNRFMLTGVDVKYENLIQCFSGGISSITWQDRENVKVNSTCEPYITSYEGIGNYDIHTANSYILDGSTKTLESVFSNIVTIQKEYTPFSTDISRIYGNTILSLPYSNGNCAMPPNEWVTQDTFNATIQKLSDNLDYLEHMSYLYDIPPTTYIGWYGSLYYNNSAIRTRWFTNTPHNSYSYDHPENAIEYTFTNLQDCYVRDNIMYVSNGTSVSILSSDLWGTILSSRAYKTLGDDFVNIRSINLDSTGRIYLLDSYDASNINAGSKNRVLVFSFNPDTYQWHLMYEWGGLGGLAAKNKFNNPSDLYIDENDVIWIADTNNKCIKKYTRTGSWLATITSTYFTDTERPVSVVTDTDGNIYALTTNTVVKCTPIGTVIDVYTVDVGAVKIDVCRDGGFMYIVYANHITKFTFNGSTAGIMADSGMYNYTRAYQSIFHDEYRNIYITNKTHILKYVDLLSTTSLKLDTTNMMWPIESLKVHKNEFIQDWVINRCFQRLWDNIEIFRQSLLGKFGYQPFQTTTQTTFVSTQTVPEDFDYCNYDWLHDKGTIVTQDIIYEYEKPVVRSFYSSEYSILPYRKEQIYIGINEINSAEVYNRVITKLYECEDTILQMIQD